MEKLDSSLQLSDTWLGKPVAKHVQDFGKMVGGIFLALGLLFPILKLFGVIDSYSPIKIGLLILVGAFLVIGAVASPTLLRPVWIYWMKMAFVLGALMTFLLLGLAWLLMFIPMALLFRALRKRTVNLEFNNGATSYWEVREEKLNDFKRLNQQF